MANNIFIYSDIMKISGNITFNFKNEKDAKLIYDSLEVDNENYLESEIEGNEINYKITSKSLGSFLTTALDLIASVIVSEKIFENTKN